ncbi:hypothetical protein HY251_09350, partial [bacterium]|nr:hypothetical protein [bacterium]
MARKLDLLDDLAVASPCKVPWEGMKGDDRVRFCGLCALNVYNVEGMSREEAIALLERSEGRRLCVRFFRRADGTVLTQDCPILLRRLKRAARWLAGGLVGALGLSAFLVARAEERSPSPSPSPGLTSAGPIHWFRSVLFPPPPPPRIVGRAIGIVVRRPPSSPVPESAVDVGLRWLARHQSCDGSWRSSGFEEGCHGGACGCRGDENRDVAVTGASMLAFLGAGYTPF